MPQSAQRWFEPGGIAARIERWVLPGECLLCRWSVEVSESDPLICAQCRSRWSPLPHPQCHRCGQPEVPGIPCRLCADWPDGLAGVRSAVWLDPAARQAVHLLKYSGWWRIADAMTETMRRSAAPIGGGTLVPIPLGVTRQRSRGYNQSAVLAESLGRLLGLPVAPHALCRRRDTTTQTALTPEERRANLAGAFVATGVPPDRPVLVDDVFTTGATLAEAARALRAAGATGVSGITFARAARPLAEAAVTAGAQTITFRWRRA